MSSDPSRRGPAVAPLRRPFRQRGAVVLLVGVLCFASVAIAQEGDDEAVDGGKAGADPLKSAAWAKVEQEAKGFRDALKAGGAFDAAGRDFLAKRAVPQLANDANRPIIDRVRRQLRDFVLVGITDDRTFDEASKTVADAALAVARDADASRPARVNAMLLIGELRAKDGKEGTAWAPAAAPLAAVAADASLDPSVRVAALSGLVRHADVARKAGGEKLAEFAKAVRPAVISIVAEPPSVLQPVASDWIASRALGMVTAVMKSAPKDFAATLAKVVDDAGRSLDIRVRAAAALGATVTPKSEIQPVETAEAIHALSVAVLEADEALLRDRRYEQQLSGGGAGAMPGLPPGVGAMGPPGRGPAMSMGGPGMPGMAGMPGFTVPQIVPDQALRRTAWRLTTLADAILTEDGKAGVGTLLSGDDQATAKTRAALLREHARTIDEARTDESLLAALAAVRPEKDAADEEADEAAPVRKPAEDDNDPFGGK